MMLNLSICCATDTVLGAHHLGVYGIPKPCSIHLGGSQESEFPVCSCATRVKVGQGDENPVIYHYVS
uniref:Uncharacterized protein n=1 Tax=Populus trichocarpa TaxID=3694 RepID=A0A2K1XBN1_POPTR